MTIITKNIVFNSKVNNTKTYFLLISLLQNYHIWYRF